MLHKIQLRVVFLLRNSNSQNVHVFSNLDSHFSISGIFVFGILKIVRILLRKNVYGHEATNECCGETYDITSIQLDTFSSIAIVCTIVC